MTTKAVTLDFGSFGGAVFDCDGVIIDSNHIKARAFRELLLHESPELFDEFTAHRTAHPGLSRTALFEFYFRDLAASDDWERRARQASLAFSEHTVEALTLCALLPGVENALAAFREAGVLLAVVSAAAREDLETILARRGLRQYFAAVCGGDRSKTEHICALLKSETLRASLIYFGDSVADRDAAEATGCRFVFVSGASDWADGARLSTLGGHDIIESFHDLQSTEMRVDGGPEEVPGSAVLWEER